MRSILTFCYATCQRSFRRIFRGLGLLPASALVFQKGNAAPHKVQPVLDYIKNEVGIGLMEWPLASPDLNRIENFCRELKTAVWNHGPINNLDDLEKNINASCRGCLPAEIREGAWKNKIKRLYQTMANRVKAVFQT